MKGGMRPRHRPTRWRLQPCGRPEGTAGGAGTGPSRHCTIAGGEKKPQLANRRRLLHTLITAEEGESAGQPGNLLEEVAVLVGENPHRGVAEALAPTTHPADVVGLQEGAENRQTPTRLRSQS